MQRKPTRADSGATDAGRELVLIVTGAHLAAEANDRPTAYSLAERARGWVEREGTEGARALEVLVCSDVWWLNDRSLRERPTISIGSPRVNALTAYLADKLPSAFAVDGSFMVQMDVELGDHLAACWGVDHALTARAVEVFGEKYLGRYLESVARGMGG